MTSSKDFSNIFCNVQRRNLKFFLVTSIALANKLLFKRAVYYGNGLIYLYSQKSRCKCPVSIPRNQTFEKSKKLIFVDKTLFSCIPIKKTVSTYSEKRQMGDGTTDRHSLLAMQTRGDTPM